MNAQTNLPKGLSAHKQTVRAMLPNVVGEELELRCRLLVARNTASFALSRQVREEDAQGLLVEIDALAARYAFADLDTDQIKKLLEGLRLMMRATAFLNEFTDLRGADARG